MIQNWMAVKVKYVKQLDNGALKRTSEQYLFAAMSFTDAESRVYEELAPQIRGEFTVQSIARFDVQDIFGYSDSDIWYKAKVKYDNVDADTENVKTTTVTMLTTASSVKEAYDRIKESLTGMLVDFEISMITKTDIIEVLPYNTDEVTSEELQTEAV